MLNWIWAVLVLGSVATAAFTGKLGEVGTASITGAKSAIEVLFGLIGPMILFLGLVRIASDAGLLRFVVRAVHPLLRRLFPDVPSDHPAMSAMVMNLAANVLGLGNAATPFGLKAMVELDRLNPYPGVATNAMALFLAINATSVTLMLPSGVIAIRAAAGSANPAAIWIPTLIATTCSTLAAVLVSLALQRSKRFAARPLEGDTGERPAPPQDLPEATLPDAPLAPAARSAGRTALLAIAIAALVAGLGLRIAQHAGDGALGREAMASWPLPLLLFAFVAYGLRSGTRVYEVAIEGGKEALAVAMRIAPYMVMILAAIAMFRASGALDYLIGALDPFTSRLGVPASVLPLMLMKPLSGSGALAVMTDVLNTVGPDSYAGLLASATQGSTETTFYVLAVYLGVIGVKNARFILPACLIGDLAGYTGAVLATRLLFPDAV
jgi:spore maturation protein SpmA